MNIDHTGSTAMTYSEAHKPTITKSPEATCVSPQEHSGSYKDEFFTVAMGSDIRPYELAEAGFNMLNWKFFPADIEEVRERLSDFVVTDESTTLNKVFRFERLPY
ncbi:hypothetical protein FZF11_20445 [Vibrio parahaemolyticus]|uniref:hypothetical protein n=2 Tax=Vibrio parahaemolyticus TaxID=670 RepID=UPI0004B38B25|nr:hypothetical protein [Vibrio parahaemolyticus]EHC7291010.1 hypothetical protein [Vibrio parahaemolyticus]MDF4269745.1 hypothetical protein [Vibrio parahaemolyticus]MDF4275081.1 hypothetical protein [Vibrio parahaemolyticus]MDF4299673.1 hypothetical protein [Vibrio parahaemolyticus]MDG3418694.1 hypothetical protein [Vibrio parahaemolyticus]